MKSIYYAGTAAGIILTAYVYEPVRERKGIIYFAHGVTEYAKRHEKFFNYLCAQGYVVIANDHMGHGNSIKGCPCYFANNDKISGWECAVQDAYKLIQMMKQEYPNIPVYGIGFSLGSFIVRHIAIDYPNLFKSIVLIGTGYQSKMAITIGKWVAATEGKKYGYNNFTDKIDQLTFGTYNKKFEGATRADWLCSSPQVVKDYLEDKNCGKGFTVGLFGDLLYGMEYTCNKSNIKKMSPDCSVLLCSGDNDAVGDYGKGVQKMKNILQSASIPVNVKMYKGFRHDILEERNNSNVYIDIAQFISKE